MKRGCGLVLILLLGLARPAAAQQLVADLTDHFVAITAGFTGTNVTLFGTNEAGGDIIVTVRGPKRDTVVRRKSHLAGIWLNHDSVTFAGVPGYYALLSSRPVEDMLPQTKRVPAGIGIDALRLSATGGHGPADADAFRIAMIEDFERTGLYTTQASAIRFLGKHLFRTTLSFPAAVPTGTYAIEVFAVRGGDIVASQAIALTIEQSGAEAVINDIAQAHALAYGIVAVAAAAMAGWLGSVLFRSAR